MKNYIFSIFKIYGEEGKDYFLSSIINCYIIWRSRVTCDDDEYSHRMRAFQDSSA